MDRWFRVKREAQMKFSFLTISAALFAAGFSSLPAAETFSCPETIAVDAKVTESFPAWEVVQNPQGHHFTRVAFYSGHPREMASLVPDRQTESSSAWEFPGKASQNFWLACEYTNTEMMLVRQLSSGFAECEVVFASQLVESITCR